MYHKCIMKMFDYYSASYYVRNPIAKFWEILVRGQLVNSQKDESQKRHRMLQGERMRKPLAPIIKKIIRLPNKWCIELWERVMSFAERRGKVYN